MLAIFSVLAGCLLSWRVMGEQEPILVLSHGVLSGSLLLIGIGNWVSRSALLAVLVLLGALCFALKAPALKPSRLPRLQAGLLALGSLLVLLYTLYHQFRFLDTDNWLHEPLIGALMRGVFPPVHPFIPELEFHYHYGRDFLVALLAPPQSDPLGTVWLINPVLQVAGYVGLFASIRSLSQNTNQGLLGSTMAYFGLCVGARVGLINTFDAYNGVASAQLFLLFHVLLRMLDQKRPVQWLYAAFLLGSYQLVYETFWALLFLAGLATALRFVRDRWGWAALVVTAVLALGLAAVEGGVFSNMVSRSNQLESSELDSVRNVTISAGFPKAQLLKIPVTAAPYQRISAAYQSGLFRGFKPTQLETGYLFIFGPQFLYAFWLPVFLAPFVGWWVRRHRVGFTFWSFGLISYLLPGLVGFGERYDLEYFRWEFSAAIGFSVAYGIALAMALERVGKPWSLQTQSTGGFEFKVDSTRRFGQWLLVWALLIASLAPAQKFLNDAVIDVQRDGLPPLTPGNWRVAHPDLGVDQVDLQAMAWLADHLEPRQKTLTNLGNESARGLWPDIVLTARTGAQISGRMRPESGLEEYAYPNYHRDGGPKAFELTGDIGFLQAAEVVWYYADLDKLSEPCALTLSELQQKSPLFEVQGARRQVFAIPQASAQLTGVEVSLEFVPSPPLRTSQAYPATVTLKNSSEKPGRALLTCAYLKQTESQDVEDQDSRYLWLTPELDPGQEVTLGFALVTPFVDGDFLFRLRAEEKVLQETPVKVDYWSRLSSVQGRLDLPDNFTATRFEQFRVGLSSELEVALPAELVIRLKRDSGEYVWEVDQIPQKVELELVPGAEQEAYLTLLAPEGDFTLELYLKDPESTRTVLLAQRGIHVNPVQSTISTH